MALRPSSRVEGRLASVEGDRRPGRDHKRAASPVQENSSGTSRRAAGRYFLAVDQRRVRDGPFGGDERRDVGRHHGRQPRRVFNEINGIYPEEKPFSTMPGTILAALPALPDDVQYRFLGHLILLDMRSNVILDRIPYAIRCVDTVIAACLSHKEKGPRD